MSPLSQLDQILERLGNEIIQRTLARRLKEFEAVWECANRICDRYEETKAAQPNAVAEPE